MQWLKRTRSKNSAIESALNQMRVNGTTQFPLRKKKRETKTITQRSVLCMYTQAAEVDCKALGEACDDCLLHSSVVFLIRRHVSRLASLVSLDQKSSFLRTVQATKCKHKVSFVLAKPRSQFWSPHIYTLVVKKIFLIIFGDFGLCCSTRR